MRLNLPVVILSFIVANVLSCKKDKIAMVSPIAVGRYEWIYTSTLCSQSYGLSSYTSITGLDNVNETYSLIVKPFSVTFYRNGIFLNYIDITSTNDNNNTLSITIDGYKIYIKGSKLSLKNFPLKDDQYSCEQIENVFFKVN